MLTTGPVADRAVITTRAWVRNQNVLMLRHSSQFGI